MSSPEGEPPLFSGLSVHALDSKNRVTVPARWRGGVGGVFYALPDPVKPAVGLLVESELRSLVAAAKEACDLEGADRRTFFRLYFSQAEPCPVDGQGRIVLPATFCKEAGFGKEVVLVGTGERIEVWGRDAWERERECGAERFREVARRLGL